MGAYAAAICSEAVGADAVIAISPQVSIDGAKVPWERRWREEADSIGAFRRDEMMARSCRKQPSCMSFTIPVARMSSMRA